MTRPLPGSITTCQVRIKICAHCGCVVSATGLCDFECALDGEPRGPEDYFWAVYERTERFVGDERV